MPIKSRSSTSLYAEPAVVRDLYTRLLKRPGGKSHNVLAVTSAIDGEGKTMVAASLAVTLANDRALAGLSKQSDGILILDCNQRLHGAAGATEEFMVEPAPGLIQYLGDERELEDIVKPTFLNHLWVMPVGGVQHNFSALIRTPRMREMMQRLRERFELIILDLPSVLTTTDTQVLIALADQALLVVRARVTPSNLLTQALQELDPEKLAGTVLNDSRRDLPEWLDHRL